MKLFPYRKVLQSWHRHSGFQDLIILLKLLWDLVVLVFIGIGFQITAPKYIIDFLPFNLVITKGIHKVYHGIYTLDLYCIRLSNATPFCENYEKTEIDL